MTNQLLEAALNYARRGWRVFPCRPKGKEPLTPAGFKNATTDEAQIRVWWGIWPDANIGLATGNGLYVLDLDGPDGEASVQGKEIPDGPQVTTGKGRHCYFQTDAPLRLFAGKLRGVDGRGEGGYVIAPPSVHPLGRVYQWIEGTEDMPLPFCPDWLAELARPKAVLTPSPRTDGEGQAILAGQRNASLTSLAGTMRKRSMSAEAIEAALLEENRNRCNPPLPEDEVRRIAASVARYPAGAEDDAELRARAAKAGVTLEQARRLLQGSDEMNPLGRLSAVFRVPVSEVLLEKSGRDKCFKLILEDGRTVPLGDGEALYSFRKVRARLAENERLVLDCKPKEWPGVVEVILSQAREVVQLGSDEAMILDLLNEMLCGAERVEKVNGETLQSGLHSGACGEGARPVVIDTEGRLWTTQMHIASRLERINYRISGGKAIAEALRSLGFEPRTIPKTTCKRKRPSWDERKGDSDEVIPQFRAWCGFVPSDLAF